MSLKPNYNRENGRAGFTKDVCDEIVTDGGIVIPLIGSHFARNWPDRLVYHRLWHGLLEFKGENTKVEPAQRENMQRLWMRKPGYVYVVRAPNKLEMWDGRLLATFASGVELMGILHGIGD